MNAKGIEGFKIKILMIMVIIMAFVGLSEAFSQAANIYKIQSLFLYNFSKHVKWEDQSSAFTIGIYGNQKAFAEIKTILEGKMMWGNNINVVQIETPADVNTCHIAYMPKSNKKKILDMMSSSDLSETLVVTEDDLMEEGAAISFVFQQSKMKFKISKTKIEQAGLKVSSSLISIGIPV